MKRLTERGTFFVGLNYWASHAGTEMWSNWNAKIVEEDLKKIKSVNISVLRVFPLWSDFQPLKGQYAKEDIYEFRLGENPLSDDEIGNVGLKNQCSRI